MNTSDSAAAAGRCQTPSDSAKRDGRTPWHALTCDEAVRQLGVDPAVGLTGTQATRRLDRYGPNLLLTVAKTTWYSVLGRQFASTLIYILLIAALIAVSIGETVDAVTILAIVALNGVLGFVQEWKAERALDALRQMLSPKCNVVREGKTIRVDAATLVPGDVVLLEIGDHVPGDLRLIESVNLTIDESALTGESVSVSKTVEPVGDKAVLAKRTSMTWTGTAVTNGLGRGVVVATGMASEFGQIAQLTQSIDQQSTPLQRKLSVLGKKLGLFAVGVSVVVAVIGFLTGKPLVEMFMTGVSLAVAVVPEGLPAVVTITLALGIRAMVRRRAVLRRLQAAEALGAATVVCTDKTGTLTQNQMTVQRVWLPAGEVQATGVGYDPAGHFEAGGHKINPRDRVDLVALLEAGLRCNHAQINKDQQGCWREVGEPTEAALVVAAYKAHLAPTDGAVTRSEFSFNSLRKRMTVIEHAPGGRIAYAKGAPEVILDRSTRILDRDEERLLTESDREAVARASTRMAESGLRTLALARRSVPAHCELEADAVEQDLTLLGVVGIIDPPRPEVSGAMRLARSAGIHVIVITGDAAATAQAIAGQIGLKVRQTITGQELDEMDDAALSQSLRGEVLFARTTPQHKLRIVSLLQEGGHVVGMTGDGVNDAPALKKADVGIAMGLRGTDVAKGASDMVLTDDNFASIINAVEEGRRQYHNIQKFVRYLLSSNTGEVVAILLNIVVGGPLIILPVQILWMNLVTDGLTAVALGVEPAETGIMSRPPRSPKEPVLNRAGAVMVLLLGSYIGLATLWLFHHYLRSGGRDGVALAQTVAFTGIIVAEKFNVLNFRALGMPLAKVGWFTNPWVIVALVLTIGLQVAAVYVPFLQRAFHTVPLGWSDWARIFVVAAPIFVLTETYKWWRWKAAGATPG